MTGVTQAIRNAAFLPVRRAATNKQALTNDPTKKVEAIAGNGSKKRNDWKTIVNASSNAVRDKMRSFGSGKPCFASISPSIRGKVAGISGKAV